MKRFAAAAIITLVVLGFIGTVSAGPAQGIKGRGEIEHLYLVEKDPSTWEIVAGGAFGIMSYRVPERTDATEKFVFSGYRLAPDTGYSLIYSLDPWPGTGLIVLGQGTSDAFGVLHIEGGFNFGAVPMITDANQPGAKIWLVLSRDVGWDQMYGWNPTKYLFEYKFI
jgi:hypothetical protein